MANPTHLEMLLKGRDEWITFYETIKKGDHPDFSNADLTGAALHDMILKSPDFSGANLKRANFRNAYLHNANFSNANLSYSNFCEINAYGAALFRGAEFFGANLQRAHLKGADLQHAKLNCAGLSGAYLRNANLSGADLSGRIDGDDDKYMRTYLHDADLENAILAGANLNACSFLNANLRNADLSNTNLGGTKNDDSFYECCFIDANLSGANLTGASIYRTDFRGANLSKAVFSKSNFKKPQLRHANLSHTNLAGFDLSNLNLTNVNLANADLSGANLTNTILYNAILDNANLSGANLSNADLTRANLVETNFSGATLSGCKVYGVSAWNLNLENAVQKDLLISTKDEPAMSVDDLAVAQFIYLMLNNKNIRNVLNTITSKGVLILGRFSDTKRKAVLDGLREKLRHFDLLPIVFDFDRPTDKDYTETVQTLAGMSMFVIADLTSPKSTPLELEATVKQFKIPYVPILDISVDPQSFAMLADLQKSFHWVLPTLQYETMEGLLDDGNMKEYIIDRVNKKREELRKAKDFVPENIVIRKKAQL